MARFDTNHANTLFSDKNLPGRRIHLGVRRLTGLLFFGLLLKIIHSTQKSVKQISPKGRHHLDQGCDVSAR